MALACAAPTAPPPGGAPDPAPTARELALIRSLGPWPPAPARDPTNPASGRADGVALGEVLFHSTRLADDGSVRCATCHEPWRRFTDARPRALGLSSGTRNTPTLLNVATHRLFGWDGANDALWRQALRPLRDAREMPAGAAHVAALIRGDAGLRARFEALFGDPAEAADEQVLADVGRALAAYAESLASAPAAFDAWRAALLSAAAAPGPPPALAPAALRGLRVFVGRGECVACHAGPTFSDDDLHLSLIHSIGPDGQPDLGRPGGPSNAFRTPALRDVAATAPYMHDGSVALLCDAVRPHAVPVGAAERAPPRLSAADRRDLVAFLESLSSPPEVDDAAGRTCTPD